jgi:hypothetical protein
MSSSGVLQKNYRGEEGVNNRIFSASLGAIELQAAENFLQV